MKDDLRKRMQGILRALPTDARRRAAKDIRTQVLALNLEGMVMAYVSVRAELGTRMLIEALGDRVAVPRVVGSAIECRRLTNWVDGPMKIPTTDGPIVQPQTVLIPGLAFDRNGGRLGYGGGFYDRFLAENPGVRTIALAYDVQVLDQVPMEPHDVRIQHLLVASTT